MLVLLSACRNRVDCINLQKLPLAECDFHVYNRPIGATIALWWSQKGWRETGLFYNSENAFSGEKKQQFFGFPLEKKQFWGCNLVVGLLIPFCFLIFFYPLWFILAWMLQPWLFLWLFKAFDHKYPNELSFSKQCGCAFVSFYCWANTTTEWLHLVNFLFLWWPK